MPPLGPALADALGLAARLVPARTGALYLDDAARRDSGDPSLTCIAAFGSKADVGAGVEPGEGARGRAYASGRTVRTAEELAVPLRLERAVCGVLALGNRPGKRFTPRHVEVAELIAGYAARAILNAVDLLKQNEWALHDELTGVLHVRALEPTLERSVRRAQRAGADLAVLFVDVDHLKDVNDTLGHRAGSETLRRVGQALRARLGDRGEVFRFGGDEFVVVAPKTTGRAALALANDLRSAVARGTGGVFDGTALPSITASVGVAALRSSARESGQAAAAVAARLLGAADRALYRAKNAGRNAAVLASDVGARVPVAR